MLDEERLIDDVMTFTETTEGVRVSVQSYYLSEQSDPPEGKYVWAYRILIENEGDIPVRLLTRHWIITDGQGATQEVMGDGVVGEQPRLEPGSDFIYTSGCPLSTPSGFMQGSYDMEDAVGRTFKVAIPAFSLDSPFGSNKVN
ncbi:MAG: Co2+/Mg2+ efflux protein ApaG [Kordiimonas sp.]